MNVKITNVSTQNPKYSRETKDVVPLVETWLDGEEERFRRKIVKIFESAKVDERYAIMPPEDVFTASSFQEKNDVYCREVKELGKKVLQKSLKGTAWKPESLDFIITVSCTGFMIPSLDAYLINELQLKQNIVRLPVTEMGCAAGVSGIIYAKQFLKANPGKRAAVIAVESPAATFQLGDKSMANMVSAAIFGDGAACALLSSEKNAIGPSILDQDMYHFYENTHLMGFDLTNNGLKMVLDIDVPEIIASHFPKIVFPFLDKNGFKIEEINHLIFHPGGKKILQTVEELFGVIGKNVDDSKEILRLFGNMSSATVLYVLERTMNKKITAGEKGLMLSFGPGFSAQQVLLEW